MVDRCRWTHAAAPGFPDQTNRDSRPQSAGTTAANPTCQSSAGSPDRTDRRAFGDESWRTASSHAPDRARVNLRTLDPQSRLRGSPPSAIVPPRRRLQLCLLAGQRLYGVRVARPDPLPCGPRCCTRCCTSPTQPGVSARCSHPARSRPPDPTAAGSARRCDDAGRHVPGAHDADRANPGTGAIGQWNCTRVGGRQGHARPGPLLLGQRRQDVERASRVPARAASRCRSPLTSRCPVGQERRRERGGEHRLERQRRAERRCSRRRLWPAREGRGKTPPMRQHPPDRCPAVSRRRRGRRCGRGRR
jgi:hypothetical protein